MTTQNGGADGYQPEGSGAVPVSRTMMPLPPLPGSPTFTNPDMILPDERASSPDRSESPLFIWKGPVTINDMQYHMPLQNSFSAPVTPTTPIIYGNGTMLSDIGEVTEVESNAGGPVSRTPPGHFYNSTNDAALRSSPTIGAHGGGNATTMMKTIIKSRPKATVRERRDSTGSDSTVTTQDRAALFADFDDSVSVDDSVFQGDDEESVAESFADDASVQSTREHTRGDGSGLNEENRFSTSSIGRRAELILANAKRRLTTMEGNLSRARSSLYINPSLSSDGSISAASPPFLSPDGASSDPNMIPSKFGHSRMPSDNLIHADGSPSSAGTFPQRPASALGAAGGYRQPHVGPKGANAHKFSNLSRTPHRRSLPGQEKGLEPLSEDEVNNELHSRPGSAQLDHFSGTNGSDHSNSRPGSAYQVREIKEQMHGLKGRISSLREQAKADSLKRRSLQSLRMPSPFTDAQVEEWHASPSKSEPNSAASRSPWNGEYPSPDEEDGAVGHTPKGGNIPDPVPEEDESELSEYELASEALRSRPVSAVANEPVQDEHQGPDDEYRGTDRGADYDNDAINDDDDGFQSGHENVSDYGSESDDMYHDAYQTPISHEDREDAFDYEHFFLHSAMGTLSQEQLGRRGSFSSEDSVETTKGPILTPEEEYGTTRRHHRRRGSGDTTSTMDTFATAKEGKNSRMSDLSFMTANDAPAEPEEEPESEAEAKPHASFESQGYVEYADNIRARRRHNSASHPPTSARTTALHRPSVSSFESTGTNRSFPLVPNKVKMNGGVLTPQGSPDEELKTVSDALMSETASICEMGGAGGVGGTPAIQSLDRDDQLLVQAVVAGLGRCVLGLSEADEASAEGALYRQRLQEVKRLLEGLESTAG
ncbi:uncharacterized protein DNG_00534 [Cephalotrichum gorgonifer]|uniref:Uncharacterized protein n=1 Tax=Cephalotrichum gorgonifer TaxID=2041049 RepID=A0AAE8MQZ8_9PEZI|nr:uncharacterized protein DNG_00534 [Cephalotrichum gorgonifer]